MGKAVAVVGISASVCAGLTACSPMDSVPDFFQSPENGSDLEIAGNISEAEPFTEMPDLNVEGMVEELQGDIAPLEETDTDVENGASGEDAP